MASFVLILGPLHDFLFRTFVSSGKKLLYCGNVMTIKSCLVLGINAIARKWMDHNFTEDRASSLLCKHQNPVELFSGSTFLFITFVPFLACVLVKRRTISGVPSSRGCT